MASMAASAPEGMVVVGLDVVDTMERGVPAPHAAWLNLNRQNRDSRANRAHHKAATLKRLLQVFSPGNGVEGANPEDVEARLRNLSHGTKGE